MAELRVSLRTPGSLLYEGIVSSVRFPTPSGQVGLRPGGEAFVTVLSPGLILLKGSGGPTHAGTAGGIARHDGSVLMLFSPFGAAGDPDSVLAALAKAGSDPQGELKALRSLAELEHQISQQVRADGRGKVTR